MFFYDLVVALMPMLLSSSSSACSCRCFSATGNCVV